MQSKAEHKEWVRKFFEGTFLVQGWNQRVEDLVAGVDEPKTRAAVKKKLDRLGKRIGAEWAKENDVRRIDSADLKRWGGHLADRKRRGLKPLEEALKTVEEEVEERLARV